MTGAERKKLLIKSAIEVFSQENYRAAKIADIASLAGVTEPVVYRHFPSKKQLYLETLTLIMKKTIDRISSETQKGENALQKLKYAVNEHQNMMNVFRKELKLEFQAVSEIDDIEVKEIIAKGYRLSFEIIESIINQGIQEGCFRKNIDSKFQAMVLVGHSIHLSAYYLADVLEADYSEQLFNYYLDNLVSNDFIS